MNKNLLTLNRNKTEALFIISRCTFSKSNSLLLHQSWWLSLFLLCSYFNPYFVRWPRVSWKVHLNKIIYLYVWFSNNEILPSWQRPRKCCWRGPKVYDCVFTSRFDVNKEFTRCWVVITRERLTIIAKTNDVSPETGSNIIYGQNTAWHNCFFYCVEKVSILKSEALSNK